MEMQQWTPASLLQLSGGYWSACALHAGVKLDLFTRLSGKGADAIELAGQLSVPVRGVEMLLNALSALALLEKNGSCYRNTPFSEEYLAKSSARYLGYIIQHHHHLMAGWARLDEAVQKGCPVGVRSSHTGDETIRECFEMGMFNMAMLVAPGIVKQLDLSRRKRLLDLGGGPGTYAIQFCLHNPDLEAVVYDLPTTRTFAEKTIASFGMEQRIRFNDGDFLAEAIEGFFDVVWISHILHGEGAENCAVILARAVAALQPGGMLYVQEFILDDSRDTPVFPALFSLNMLVGTESGQSYSEGELKTMMSHAGLGEVTRMNIDLPNGAGIIAGKVP